MNVTALTVSRAPVRRSWTGLEHRNLAGRIFGRAADVQAAWFDAIALVDTPHFFFVDDDDELPPDYLSVLSRCLEAGSAIAYTDEQVGPARRHRAPYSQAAHLKDPALVHHLVLCETAAARAAVAALPRGDFWPEMLLYWHMAAAGGATHVPEVGYLWHRRATGPHAQWFTVRGMHNARAWCAQNRSAGTP